MKSMCVAQLTNPELLAQAERLVVSERRCAAELVVHVAEIERRRLHLSRGFHCVHAYCTEALGLSDYEAFNRIEAARAGQQFPRAFEMLLDGALSLTTVQLLARRLPPENHLALLAESAGKTKKEAQHLWRPPSSGPCGCGTEAVAVRRHDGTTVRVAETSGVSPPVGAG